ncbi:MAG: HMA2 domain-containing protein [Thermodesulfobacteriota bacterium]
MNPTLILSILSALTAAVWSVWTWREEQQKERQLKRDQESAIFVNSFIQATEELQSRLYGVLEGDDLAFYKKEYPEQHELGSPFAIEMLYRLSKFFGWAYRIFRYGPYTNDPVVIELIRKIGEALESHTQFPGNAFRFTYEERVALGAAVVRRTGDVIGSIPVFESATVFQFLKEMSDKSSKQTNLFESRSVRRTLAAIDEVDQPGDLEGVERLAVLQNHLVDLLAYLEEMEGFSVSPAKRRKAWLRGTAAEALPSLASDTTVVHQTPGRIRLKVPRLRMDETYAPLLKSLLDSMDNITSIRINISAASVVIGFSPEIPGMEFAQRLTKIIKTGSLRPSLT